MGKKLKTMQLSKEGCDDNNICPYILKIYPSCSNCKNQNLEFLIKFHKHLSLVSSLRNIHNLSLNTPKPFFLFRVNMAQNSFFAPKLELK
jgi:hypothetical protein